MATDTPSGGSRPRPWLLVLLGLAIVAYVLTWMFSGGPVSPTVTTTGPRPADPVQSARIEPEELDVKIEALGQPRNGQVRVDRNPFGFRPKPPPPPPPPPPPVSQPKGPGTTRLGPQEPALTPIGNLIKFIGIVETGKERIGAFSDCRYTFPGREGEIIEGRFRVVRIGVESAVVEYVDGKGRTTLPLNGQACVGK